jgi:hypothetical protein
MSEGKIRVTNSNLLYFDAKLRSGQHFNRISGGQLIGQLSAKELIDE